MDKTTDNAWRPFEPIDAYWLVIRKKTGGGYQMRHTICTSREEAQAYCDELNTAHDYY